MGDASIWAEAGGLVGLVIMSLFGALGTFFWVLNKKDTQHAKFISKILEDEREERHEDRREHKEAFDNLANALRDLTTELQRKSHCGYETEKKSSHVADLTGDTAHEMK